MQGWDRYAYVNNSPIMYTDPSGHYCLDGGEVRGRSVANLCLTEEGQNLLDFAKQFGITVRSVITAAMAGEAGGWAGKKDVMTKKEEAWGLRYQWYVKKFCGGIDVPNCKSNFFMDFSQSVSDMVHKNWDALAKRVKLMTNNLEGFSYFEEQNWAAGDLIYNAVQNPKSEWRSFDPENNPDDRNKFFDVDIKPVSVTNHPTIGLGYDQFGYFQRGDWGAVPSYSVILTYCQWQYWRGAYSSGLVDVGCSAANP